MAMNRSRDALHKHCTGIVDQDIDPAESLVGFRINCRRPMIRGQVAVDGHRLAGRRNNGPTTASARAEMGWRNGMAAAEA